MSVASDLHDFLRNEVTRAERLLNAKEWLGQIATLDGAAAESKQRLTGLASDEAAAKDRLAALASEHQNIIGLIAQAKITAGQEVAQKKIDAHDVISAANDRVDSLIAEAKQRAEAIVSEANDKARQIATAVETELADIRAELTGAKQEHAATVAAVTSAKSALDAVRAEAATLRNKLLG